MYAEFSYDLVPGTHPNNEVLDEIIKTFGLMPNGTERRRCHLLSDTFICQVANLNDFSDTNARLETLRTQLGGQFNYTFSLRRKNALIEVRGEHNSELAKEIIEA